MAGNLIIPRVEVVWGDSVLTAPSEDFGPLVYDVKVSLEDQGQTPTGSMKWNPTGAAIEQYEFFLKNFSDYSIIVRFFYLGGNSITFEFYWGGQSDTYGKEMEVNVKLVSLLDGLINANFYATVQASRNEKGISHADGVANLEKQFGISDLGLDLIQYTDVARKDCSKALVKASYNDGSNFSDAVQNLVKDNGNNVFLNNIGRPNAVVYTPYVWEGLRSKKNTVEFRSGVMGIEPDPAKRYGYFIGPYIIESITRTNEWQPPQKSQEINATYARKALLAKQAKQRAAEAKREERRRRAAEAGRELSSNRSTSPSGVYGAKNSYNILSSGNEDGPVKQDYFTKERSAKLSMSTLMCPSLVGIKPLDIIFVPNLSGTYMEDWIVSSVEYQQNSSGGVELSIQATRTYGTSEPMNSFVSDEWNVNAKDTLFTGATGGTLTGNGLLDKWVEYAWLRYSDKYGAETSATSPSTTASRQAYPSENPNLVLLKGSGIKISKYLYDELLSKGLSEDQLNSLTRGQLESQRKLVQQSFPYPSKPFEQVLVNFPVPDDKNAVKLKDLNFYDYLQNEYGGIKTVKFSEDTLIVRGLTQTQLQQAYRNYQRSYPYLLDKLIFLRMTYKPLF